MSRKIARATTKLIKRKFMAFLYSFRTHIPCQVLSYDAATNTVEVQPVIKGIVTTDPNNGTIELAPLAGVPVAQLGSGKLWFTVTPQVDAYGLLHISDRSFRNWYLNGGIVEPTSDRCGNINDAVFYPSILPKVVDGDNGAFDSEDELQPIKADRVSMRTRSGITEVSVLDDETILAKNEKGQAVIGEDGAITVNNENATVSIDKDGNITVTNAGNLTVDTDGDVTLTAGGKVTTSATETVVQDGSDYAVQYTALKSAFDTLKTDFNNFINLTYNLHNHPTAPVGPVSVPALIGTPTTADMTSSKVADVRLP